MKQFMDTNVTTEILESARLDGAKEFRIFWSIAMPMVKPAWLTTIVTTFQQVWAAGANQYVWSEDLKTFNSMLSQEVTVERLLPIEKPEHTGKRLVSAVYDPSPEKVLKNTMPAFIAGRIYSAVCDSFASEVAARRTAMDSATKNAGEMISDLTLRYNRARQGAITQEITEIVAGAEH